MVSKTYSYSFRIKYRGDNIRIFIFLVGFGLSIIGYTYIITYLNYLSIGYSFLEYWHIISTSYECYLALIGNIIIFLTIFMKGNKYGLHI